MTPLIPKYIKVYECLCVAYHPDFAEEICYQVPTETWNVYENSVSTEARVDLYNATLDKYKDEAETAALQNIRKEVREESKSEVIVDCRGELTIKL